MFAATRNSWYFSHDLLALGVYTQLALVLKKKQFERLRLATWIVVTDRLGTDRTLDALDRRVLTVNWTFRVAGAAASVAVLLLCIFRRGWVLCARVEGRLTMVADAIGSCRHWKPQICSLLYTCGRITVW